MIRPESASYHREQSKSKRKASQLKNTSINIDVSSNHINGIYDQHHNIENVENMSTDNANQTKTQHHHIKTTEHDNKINLAIMFMRFQLEKMGFFQSRFEPIIRNFISQFSLQDVGIKNIRKWVLKKRSLIVDIILKQKASNIPESSFLQKNQQLSVTSNLFRQNVSRGHQEQMLQIQSRKSLTKETYGKTISTNIIKVQKSRKQQKIEQRTIICPICLLQTNQFIPRACGHVFCNDCMRNYILQNNGNGNFLIDCPQLECFNKISEQQAGVVLNRRNLQRFIKFKQKITLQNNPNNKFCTRPDCDQLLIQNQQNKLYCKKCKITFCSTCQQQSHEGKDCGQAMQKEVEETYKNFKIKKCPSCSSPIQKIDGCNHMTCKKCKFQFCWICLQKYSPYHYRIYNCCGCPGLQFEDVEETAYKRFLQAIFFILLPIFISLAACAICIILPLYMVFNLFTRPCKWLSQTQSQKCQLLILQKLCCCLPECAQVILGYFLFAPRSILYTAFVAPVKYFISVGNLICNVI